MASLSLQHINKTYPNGFQAVKDFNLEIEDKEFIIFVGPSGCGKSTTLRMIAGLEEISGGTLKIGDKVMNDVEPKDRDIAMVFQNYALYPHMTVYDNMAFGLKLRKVPKDQIDKAVREAARILDLEKLLDRKPKALSGGQRQRIGIARALYTDPELLIFDEATSALDVSVQESVIELLVRLQKEKNICMIFICHDLALIRSFAHQIAVMYLGHIVETLPGEDVSGNAVHPYTRALVGAQFSVHMDPSKKIESIESEAPSPLDVPTGCPFQNRCEHCMEICKKKMPELKEISKGHEAACFYVEKAKKQTGGSK